jgi:hypothetical protein
VSNHRALALKPASISRQPNMLRHACGFALASAGCDTIDHDLPSAFP